MTFHDATIVLSLSCKQQSRHDHIIDSHSHVRNDEGQDHQGDGTSLVRHQGISELKKSQSCRWNGGTCGSVEHGAAMWHKVLWFHDMCLANMIKNVSLNIPI